MKDSQPCGRPTTTGGEDADMSDADTSSSEAESMVIASVMLRMWLNSCSSNCSRIATGFMAAVYHGGSFNDVHNRLRIDRVPSVIPIALEPWVVDMPAPPSICVPSDVAARQESCKRFFRSSLSRLMVQADLS